MLLNRLNFKRLFLIACFLLTASALSACSTVGVSKPAALQVTSKPEASVFLDGKHLGKTPFFSDQLKAGEYTVKITASQASYVDKITLRGGTLTVVNRDLSDNIFGQAGENLWLEKGRGLFLGSSPQGTAVTIDGKLVGNTPLLLTEVTDGEHKVILTKAGFIDREFALKTSSSHQLVADVTLASVVAKEPLPSPSPGLNVKKVTIASTPQGFLRVRQDPSTNAPEIARVKTGDQLEVIQETAEWIKISFDGKQGWISAQYVKKL